MGAIKCSRSITEPCHIYPVIFFVVYKSYVCVVSYYLHRQVMFSDISLLRTIIMYPLKHGHLPISMPTCFTFLITSVKNDNTIFRIMSVNLHFYWLGHYMYIWYSSHKWVKCGTGPANIPIWMIMTRNRKLKGWLVVWSTRYMGN